MRNIYKLISVVLTTSFLLTLSACSNSLPSQGKEPLTIGKLANFKKELVKGGDFYITTYQKVTDKNSPYVFYLEGDGHSYVNNRKVSDDPTPYSSMLLRLASMDKRPNIIYIARPCQYTPMNLNPTCDKRYWSSKMYSEEVVSAMNEVIERTNNGQPFSLVGFSGGGAIAVLIAAKSNKIKDIITIAGNLDHKAVYQQHKAPFLTDSLNPIDYAQAVRNIPQLHLSGGKDKVINVVIADKFVKAVNSTCAYQYVIPEASHNKGWVKSWLHIIEDLPLTCYKS